VSSNVERSKKAGRSHEMSCPASDHPGDDMKSVILNGGFVNIGTTPFFALSPPTTWDPRHETMT